MLLPLLAFALSVVQPIVVKAPAPAPAVFDSPRVPDSELSEMRGGFNLPDGLDIAIGIDVQTRIDGALALHTVYNSEGPDAGIHAYSGDNGPASSSGGTSVPGTAAGASVSVSRSASGATVVSTPSTPAVTIASNASPASTGGNALPLTANGAPVQTASGSYSLSSTDRGDVVTYAGPSIEVQHLIGQATGVVIANTANNRTIDTASTINIDMQNVPVAAISSAFLAARAAFDSARAH
ncbi:hypothetical protein [Sphingomonas sp. PR090111-T3T-6A]|uniref:hypothetical protein n=1 Tax=Sphingomonas sp. PR090111-T3T-6A TaxID=685778 RepID=UPI00038046C9|nr:hypothetical protein [Sphingomonas sp. PR090111-T3T-6A]